MTDTFDAATRSTIMASVRGTGNASTEQRLGWVLSEHRIIGWRRGVSLQGKPDFVFRAERMAIFVDGCFWHGCPRHRRVPVSRIEYSVPKLARNMQRDRAVTRALRCVRLDCSPDLGVRIGALAGSAPSRAHCSGASESTGGSGTQGTPSKTSEVDLTSAPSLFR